MGRLLIQFPGSTNAKVSNETLPKNTIVIDEDNKQLRLHDGVTRGGFPIGDRGGAAPATTDLDNLTMTGRNIGNWSTNVSNCITEIPQDIKLELSNGTLTLKAGSKVYVPNGAGVFDVYTVVSDISRTFSVSSVKTLICLDINNLTMPSNRIQDCTSGTTPPSGSGMFYDISANTIRAYSSGTPSTNKVSFPFAQLSFDSSGNCTIDLVFNGFGYIGSTVFALPGVKGLIPDGRNADGSLKSIEVTVNNVLTHTGSYNNQPQWIVLYSDSINPWDSVNWIGYNSQENILFNKNGSSSVTSGSKIAGCICAFLSADGNQKITAFTPKIAFHAVDSDDVEFIINTVFKKVSALPASPDPDTWYAIPE